MASWRSDLLSYNRVEPVRRIELRLPPYQGGVLPLPLNRRDAGRPGFEPGSLSGQSRAGLPLPPAPIKSPRPASNRRPDAYKASALPVELQGRSTLGGSRTRINLALNQARLPGCGASAWSLWTDSNGLLRVTTPVLCRVSYRGVAAHRGFEPRLPDPESSVLPVGRMGIECGRCDSNAHTARFELARSRRLPSLPHGAPPGT